MAARPEPTPATPPAVREVEDTPRRILVVGGPGSGKSTLSRRLAAALGHPVHELDRIAYEGRDFAPRRAEDRMRDAEEIARQQEWIAEGIHLGWTDPLMARADLIVWLDYTGWLRSAVRILRRFTEGAVGEARTHTGAKRFNRFDDYRRHLRQLLTVLVTTREYYGPAAAARRYPVTREEVGERLRRFEAKVVRCVTAADVERIVDRFQTP